MRASSNRRPRPATTAAAAADADSSCGDSGFSGTSACASPTHAGHQHQHHQQQQPFLLADSWQLNAMAMSAISELPSATSSPKAAAAGSATAELSSHRLTQSLSYGKGPSAQARRQALAHSLAMLGHETRTRQRELDKRERDVQEATTKATEQIEYVLRTTERAYELEDENQQLRSQVEVYKVEIGKLLDELQDREAELAERDEELARREDYCEELLRELGRSRQDIAQIRTRADQLKVENTVLSASRAVVEADGVGGAGSCDNRRLQQQLEAECEDLRRANQRLQRQAAQAESGAVRAAAELAELRARVGDLAEERRRLAEEQGSDVRSKRELLQAIRRLAEDKMAWEAYCARLLRRAVECAPQLLCAAASAGAVSYPEGRWEGMFATLFKAVMQKDPRLAECVTACDPAQQLPQRPPQPQPQQQRRSATIAGQQQQPHHQRPILQPTMRSTRAAAAAAPRQLPPASTV